MPSVPLMYDKMPVWDLRDLGNSHYLAIWGYSRSPFCLECDKIVEVDAYDHVALSIMMIRFLFLVCIPVFLPY